MNCGDNAPHVIVAREEGEMLFWPLSRCYDKAQTYRPAFRQVTRRSRGSHSLAPVRPRKILVEGGAGYFSGNLQGPSCYHRLTLKATPCLRMERAPVDERGPMRDGA